MFQVKVNPFSQISTYQLLPCETELNKVLLYIRTHVHMHTRTPTDTHMHRHTLIGALLLGTVMSPIKKIRSLFETNTLYLAGSNPPTPSSPSILCVCRCVCLVVAVNLRGPTGQFSFIVSEKLHLLYLRSQSSTPVACGTR